MFWNFKALKSLSQFVTMHWVLYSGSYLHHHIPAVHSLIVYSNYEPFYTQAAASMIPHLAFSFVREEYELPNPFKHPEKIFRLCCFYGWKIGDTVGRGGEASGKTHSGSLLYYSDYVPEFSFHVRLIRRAQFLGV